MQQDLTIRLPSAQADDTDRTAVSLVLPLIGSLCQTYGILWLLCHTPPGATLTWPGLFRTVLFFLIVTAVAHAFALWINRRLLPGQIDTPGPVLFFAIWPSVVWLPLLVLLVRENSILTALIPPLIAIAAANSIKQWLPDHPAAAPVEAGPISTLFHLQRPPAFLRTLAPAALASLALQAAIAELALGNSFTAGLLFSICALLAAWAFPAKRRPFPAETVIATSLRAAFPRTLAVFLLLTVALIPYLKPNPFSNRLRAFLHLHRATTSASAHHGPIFKQPPDTAYSGFILIPPPKPSHRIVPPPPASSSQSSTATAKPVVIPFDGAYWYFKPPDEHPRPDARVVHGDPTKANIRSTDFRSLSMEAHQHLGTPIQMDCCSAVRVSITNADDRPGAISIEVLLERTDVKGTTTQSLGTQLLRSSETQSISLNRPPVDEVLTFRFPQNSRGRQFDEISVIVRPAKERSRAGAHIAIRQFVLAP